MSETKTFTGKIKKTGLSLTEFLEGIVYEEDYDFTLEDEAKNVFQYHCNHDKYFIDTNQDNPMVWEYLEMEEHSDDYYCQLKRNADNTVSFHTSFYNGGTCLDEMLSDAIVERGLDE